MKYTSFKQMFDFEVDELQLESLRDMVHSMNGFPGVRFSIKFPIFSGLNKLIREMREDGVGEVIMYRVQSIVLETSSKQGILKSPRKHCKTWSDLKDIDKLGLNTDRTFFRLKKVLIDYDVVRYVKCKFKGTERLIVNPTLGVNSNILNSLVYQAYKDKLELPYIFKRYFEVGYDSNYKIKR